MDSYRLQKRVKVIYEGEMFLLGSTLPDYQLLVSSIKSSIPSLAYMHSFLIYSKEGDGDFIINNSQALLELFELNTTIKLEVKLARVSQRRMVNTTDKVFPFRKCLNVLKSCFNIVIGGKVVGLGVVINSWLALTAAQNLSSEEQARSAVALFDLNSFPYHFNPRELFIISDGITVVSFENSIKLINVRPFDIENRFVPDEGSLIYTFHQPTIGNTKFTIKSAQIKAASRSRLDYDTIKPCGPKGSPVFDCDFNLVGLQLTQVTTVNSALTCREICKILMRFPEFRRRITGVEVEVIEV
jgi:hypothetical protein